MDGRESADELLVSHPASAFWEVCAGLQVLVGYKTLSPACCGDTLAWAFLFFMTHSTHSLTPPPGVTSSVNYLHQGLGHAVFGGTHAKRAMQALVGMRRNPSQGGHSE